MEKVFILGIVAVLMTVVSKLMMLSHVALKKVTNGMQYSWISIVIIAESLWLWYGIWKGTIPVYISAGIGLIIALSLLTLKITYEMNGTASHQNGHEHTHEHSHEHTYEHSHEHTHENNNEENTDHPHSN